MISSESRIQVSVCIPTYNHENLLSQCLDSLVNQKTSFKYEIIIGEDGSTDTTRSIVEEYTKRYPQLIIPVFYEKNVGVVENIKTLYKKARGKYIAHIDGDDLALPNKLQLQFKALEENKNCSVCSHNMYCINMSSKRLRKRWFYKPDEYDVLDLYYKMPFFAHSSKMFRNIYEDEYWDRILDHPSVLDIEIHIENLEHGNILHLSEFLGEYRIGSGITSSKTVNEAIPTQVIKVFEEAKSSFKSNIQAIAKINHGYAIAMLKYAYLHAVNNNDIERYSYYLNKSRQIKKIGLIQDIFSFGGLFPKLFFPLLKVVHRFLGYH